MKQAQGRSLETHYAETMRVEQVGRTLVLVHAPCPISPEDWSAYCQGLLGRKISGVVVFAPPGCPGPDADQRRQASQAFKLLSEPVPVSIVTTSPLHRHLITALNWLTGGTMRGFAPTEMEAGLAFAKVGEADRRNVLAAAKRVAESFGVDGSFPGAWRS